MSNTTLADLGLALIEMRCPHCHSIQQLQTRSVCLDPRLTRCSHCKQLLVYQLMIKTKPNHILFVLHFLPVFADKQDPQSINGELPHANATDSTNEEDS